MQLIRQTEAARFQLLDGCAAGEHEQCDEEYIAYTPRTWPEPTFYVLCVCPHHDWQPAEPAN